MIRPPNHTHAVPTAYSLQPTACSSGVALLEAMLSVAIVAIGMLTAMRAIGFGASLQSRLEKRTVVRRLAEQQVAALAAKGQDALQSESSGQFEPPFTDYRWAAVPVPPTEQAPFTLLQLNITRGQGEKQKPLYALQTLVR